MDAKIKDFIEKNNLTEEKRVKHLIKDLMGKELELKGWNPPKDNPNWSHDHCEFCNKEISNLTEKESEGYTDRDNCFWICKTCFKEHLKNKT